MNIVLIQFYCNKNFGNWFSDIVSPNTARSLFNSYELIQCVKRKNDPSDSSPVGHSPLYNCRHASMSVFLWNRFIKDSHTPNIPLLPPIHPGVKVWPVPFRSTPFSSFLLTWSLYLSCCCTSPIDH